MARSPVSSPVALPGTSVNHVPGRPVAVNLVLSLRPGQWTKNLLVFAGLLFGNASVGRGLLDGPTLIRATAAFVIFCALSGVVYLVNDIADRESDRQHPIKAQRPIASGALTVAMAIAAAIAIGGGALAGAALVGRTFLLVAVCYLGLQLLYSGPLKQIV